MSSNRPNAERRRRLRDQVAARDGLACFYCGTRFSTPHEATLDHLVPKSVLPGWSAANLVLACFDCNQAKADRLPQEILRPTGFGPGLVPNRPADRTPTRPRVRSTVRHLIGRTVSGLSAAMSATIWWTVRKDDGQNCPVAADTTPGPVHANGLAGPALTGAVTGPKYRTNAPSPVVRCGRCKATCDRDRLDDEPLRWLLCRPETGTAYCWRCVAAIADELLLLST